MLNLEIQKLFLGYQPNISNLKGNNHEVQIKSLTFPRKILEAPVYGAKHINLHILPPLKKKKRRTKRATPRHCVRGKEEFNPTLSGRSAVSWCSVPATFAPDAEAT